MKKLLLTFLLTFALVNISGGERIDQEHYGDDIVYICTGNYSTKYHKRKSCKGLLKCGGYIKEVTRDAAENKYGRTPCKICKP